MLEKRKYTQKVIILEEILKRECEKKQDANTQLNCYDKELDGMPQVCLPIWAVIAREANRSSISIVITLQRNLISTTSWGYPENQFWHPLEARG